MSRNRYRNKTSQVQRPELVKNNAIVQERKDPPILIPLPDEIAPLLEAGRNIQNGRVNRAKNGMRSISQAWDDTEALGITADMRRSGPGMLSDQDRKDTLFKAYLNSVWISACVDVISKRITSGGYTLEYTGDSEQPTPEEEKQKEQLKAFVEYTNEDEDFLQLVRSIVTDILIYGECFVEIVRQGGIPYSLHKIDCITMNYSLDMHGNIVRYLQNMYHSTETIEFPPEDVMRFWLPSPNASKIALSPIERIMASIDADVHMSDWARSFFRKGARPNFWIKFEGPKEEADRFVVWLRENYTGMANAHVPLVLYDGAELYEIGKGSVDVDFLKGREHMCKEILTGYLVPPALVGLIESGNIGGGTGESQEKSFLRNACDPLRAMVMSQINYRITQKGFNITSWRIGTHYADYREEGTVSVIRDRDIRNGSLNINEVRRDMNRPPINGGDINVIVTTKEIQPLDRLPQLSDEQAAQSQATTSHVQAQATLAQAQADKLKEPPAPVAPPLTPPQPPVTPNGQALAKEHALLQDRFNKLMELQERQSYIEQAHHESTQLLNEMFTLYRLLVTAEDAIPVKLQETISHIDEQLCSIREQDNAPRKKRARKKTGDVKLETTMQVEQSQGHTGIMIAFMLDNNAARSLALPGGEPVEDLHITLAYLGDMADATFDVDRLKQELISFASESIPLHGSTGELGRFSPSDSSDGKSPIVALVNIPGLQEWRANLVKRIESMGVEVAKNFDYTPHITLAYIDANAPLPVEDVPSVDLVLDRIWLCIGAKRISFPIGDEQYPQYWQDKENTEKAIQKDEIFLGHVVDGDNIVTVDSSLNYAWNIEIGHNPTTMEEALSQWEQQAKEDEPYHCWRTFESDLIPPALHEQIKDGLHHCVLPGSVQVVFEQARKQAKEYAAPHDKVVLRQGIQEIFKRAEERGRKALEEGY